MQKFSPLNLTLSHNTSTTDDDRQWWRTDRYM